MLNTGMKILVIEDNLALQRRLQTYMDNQFTIQAVQTASEGIEKAVTNHYDAIVLDLGLPDQSGEEVCQIIRSKGVPTPLLVLTAETNTKTKVRLLEQYADDYLTKPFKLIELQARLRALNRRRPGSSGSSVIKVADLTVDPIKRQAQRAGVNIKLRRREFDILEYFVRNPGRVLTRQMILDHVWQGDRENWSNTVDVHIKHLRDKIDRPFEKPLIQTAYGLGYMLSAS